MEILGLSTLICLTAKRVPYFAQINVDLAHMLNSALIISDEVGGGDHLVFSSHNNHKTGSILIDMTFHLSQIILFYNISHTIQLSLLIFLL